MSGEHYTNRKNLGGEHPSRLTGPQAGVNEFSARVRWVAKVDGESPAGNGGESGRQLAELQVVGAESRGPHWETQKWGLRRLRNRASCVWPKAIEQVASRQPLR